MFLLKDTTQWHRWGSNPRHFGLKSSTLPLSHALQKAVAMLHQDQWEFSCHQIRCKFTPISNNRWQDYHIFTYLIWALWLHAIYLFTNSIIKSCDSPHWLIQTCYQSISSHVTENHFFDLAMWDMFQNMFKWKNLIIVLLNTVITIIVIA